MECRTGMTIANANADTIKTKLAELGDPEKAAHALGFFKTGPGEYGEDDQFIGVRVPDQRRLARQYRSLPLNEIDQLIASPIHEHRLTGLLVLVDQFAKNNDAPSRQEILKYYLSRLDRVNNWDLVDLSAPKILGLHLLDHPKERAMLFTMAKSNDLWQRRVAVLATLPMIRQGRVDEILKLAENLLTDSHDLMHKAVGWMLREVGRSNLTVLEEFLEIHAAVMPRTMLRYAIERMTPARRQYFRERKRS